MYVMPFGNKSVWMLQIMVIETINCMLFIINYMLFTSCMSEHHCVWEGGVKVAQPIRDNVIL